jgi:hypothetical protein
MKVHISKANELKEKYSIFSDWKKAMIREYGADIVFKTDEIWNILLDHEKENILNDQRIMKSAEEHLRNSKNYSDWNGLMMKEHGYRIGKHLSVIWSGIDGEIKLNEVAEQELKRITEEKIRPDEELEKFREEFQIIFWLKLVGIAFLLISFLKLPYGFYTLLRIVITGTATYSTYIYYKAEKKFWMWTLGVIAILFNPIVPIYLEKETWKVIDITTAIIFLISIFNLKEFRKAK